MGTFIIKGNMTKEQIDAFLVEPLLARIATASIQDLQPHVVPVWYYWDREILWISTFAGSQKAKDLTTNPHCAVTIDLTEGGLRYRE